MALSSLSMLAGVLCLISLTGVLADDCAPYVGSDLRIHGKQECILSFCAGSCWERYCGLLPGTMLDQSQFSCLLNNLYVVIGVGLLIGLSLVASLITCICKCCLCCHLSSRPSRSHVTSSVAVTNVTPQPIVMPMAYAAGYQPVPSHPMHARPADKACMPPPYPGEASYQFKTPC
ncbi:Hypothetical predicted protein [Pelobates cultripes]|uniref:Shisa N-terminal domain-containing protein n=1 Tax=Pelobates cultripes TaxID=61616 RepID=A0AAD1SVW9_PELCU|nr:Hypothetical predicted protein [Pelobates cultripes]